MALFCWVHALQQRHRRGYLTTPKPALKLAKFASSYNNSKLNNSNSLMIDCTKRRFNWIKANSLCRLIKV